ncbi:3-hydroxyisobutyrate dehydrogenase, mitochondrial [Hondaea fermentalgiana]|uniref:3-hydroxyisobutyrate dehydrogenase, mitochondrial n=1 Tax=Hondaea fermentalgiana TaxID=2315210 RepID=A0A2R5G381_9STRA|nr:3-hydroxyisobutyrate dehydrogenase, mitochondrial [Hondaea fermentalgiana]|eukprot:GBG24198.1 3-hydroxyisobutyrate dehydrogenase, mitochondrial [Hondaea fermentalgiana]
MRQRTPRDADEPEQTQAQAQTHTREKDVEGKSKKDTPSMKSKAPSSDKGGAAPGIMNAPELTLLAVPNVLGGLVLAFVVYKASMEAGPMRSALWLCAFVSFVIFTYFNIGQATTGKMVDGRSATWSAVPECKVAFLGLGTMGYKMAGNLQAHSRLKVAVWNRNANVADKHAKEHQSEMHANVKDAVKDCKYVFCCLPTTQIVREVLKDVTEETTVIDCTSGEPDASRELAEELSKRGIRYIDAPVSGGPKGALAATLTIMVGCQDEDTFDEIEALLEVIGQKVIHVGPVGSGHAVKAINNSMNASALLLSAEGLLALSQVGVKPDVALDVINASSGRNLSTQERIPKFVLTGDFNFGFSLKLMSKDNNIASTLMKGPLSDGYATRTAKLLQEACEELEEGADFTACVKLLESRVGVQLRSEQRREEDEE